MTRTTWCLVALLTMTGDVAASSTARPPARTRNVAIVVFEGVELLDFAGPTQVFAAAAGIGATRGRPAFHVYTVAPTKAPIVSHGVLKVVPEYSIDDAPPPDIVVFPGGNSGALTSDPTFMAWVGRVTAHDTIAMSVCTGAFVLAKAGLLDGKAATTWYDAIEGLRKAAPKATVQEGRRFIDQGRVVTTAGVSAGIDGSLHVVARLLGRAVADATARYMEYHWNPEAYLARGYALVNPSLDAYDRALASAELLEDERRWPEALAGYRALARQAPDDAYTTRRLANAFYRSGDVAAAIEAGKRAARAPELRADVLVDLACIYASVGRRDEALQALEDAVSAGLTARWRLRNESELEALHAEPRYQKLLAAR